MSKNEERARQTWKKKFQHRIAAMERLFRGDSERSATERWCPQCERFHSTPVIEIDEADE